MMSPAVPSYIHPRSSFKRPISANVPGGLVAAGLDRADAFAGVVVRHDATVSLDDANAHFSATTAERNGGAQSCDGVAKVITCVRPMINRVPAAARRPTLEAAKLIDSARMVEQPHRFRINEWQRGQVELRAIEFAVTIRNAMPVKSRRAPLGSIRVPHGLLDAVTAEQFDELRNDGLRIERRRHFADRIDDNNVALHVTDRGGHGIVTAA